MARLNEMAGNAEKGLREGKKSGRALAALLAVMACVGAGLSGCAGLANTTNASPTPQETIQISPSIITFPKTTVGQTTTQTATLTNTGNDSVTVTQLALSSTEFAVSGLTTPLTLGPGQSSKFQVSYHTKSATTTSGTLSAMTSHGGHSSHAKLNVQSGSVTTSLALSATALNFGSVLVNGSSTQNVTLKNSGSSDLQVSQIGVAGNGFSVGGVTAPVTIPAGQSATLQTKYSPTTAGGNTGTITISSNATNAMANVTLSGNGVAGTYTMSLSPASLSFGNVNAGSTAKQTVQLSNTGNSSVTLTQVAASGSGISVSGISTPVTIAPSQNVSVTVQYAPSASGTTSGA
jgi:hypothetical protein